MELVEGVLLTKSDWAATLGVTTKTVDRWLAVGLPRAAVRKDGRWFFPAGTPRPSAEEIAGTPPSGPVSTPAAPSAAVAVTTPGVAPGPIVVGGTLEEFAHAAGCSPRGVRHLYADVMAHPGLPIYVGPYGPHGSMRVVRFT